MHTNRQTQSWSESAKKLSYKRRSSRNNHFKFHFNQVGWGFSGLCRSRCCHRWMIRTMLVCLAAWLPWCRCCHIVVVAVVVSGFGVFNATRRKWIQLIYYRVLLPLLLLFFLSGLFGCEFVCLFVCVTNKHNHLFHSTYYPVRFSPPLFLFFSHSAKDFVISLHCRREILRSKGNK